MPKIKDIIDFLETFAPSSYQESYDNTGLLTGNAFDELNGVLITLDITETVIEEAIKKNCNLIISHHPIIFKGLKKLTGGNYVERVVISAIKNNLALYASHTNLDNVYNGVNKRIADKIGLLNTRILAPKKNILSKLTTFVPIKDTEKVLEALSLAGAGNIGNYKKCSFRTEGIGTFLPSEQATPTIGIKNKLEEVKENRIEVLFPTYLQKQIIAALYAAHPYEEVAYYLQQTENENQEVGSGIIGELEEKMEEKVFFQYLKKHMQLKSIKITSLLNKPIKVVAICGGAGSFLISHAIASKADVFISSDFKYHEFFDAENKIVITDIGHYESEIFTKDLIYEILKKYFTNIALNLSETVTNPISYF
ncbi:MAG: Nif3-like dinuclear metal center hexameric protein [Bacteroidota bacterium]|nr:Nif3-like dinuclear metal center hexameric protein [Bacteroidota bacterium]